MLHCNRSVIQEIHFAFSYIKEIAHSKGVHNIAGSVINSKPISVVLQHFRTWMEFLSKLLNSINHQGRLHYQLATNIGCLLKLLQKR